MCVSNQKRLESSSWAVARASCVNGAVIASTLGSVSASILPWPDIWRMSVVKCEIMCRWLKCRVEQLSLFWWKAYVSGLWSVKMVKSRASSMWQKYLSLLDRQRLLVVGAVFLLCRAQLPGEEDEGLTDALQSLLEDGTLGGRSVPYKGKWSGRNRMSQKCSSRQACFTFVDSCDACFRPGDGMRSFNLGT